MMEQQIQLRIDIIPYENDEAEIMANLTRDIRDDFLELEIKAVDYIHKNIIPEKTKSGEIIEWGTLLLTLAASGGVITTIVTAIQSWLSRHERRSIVLEIDQDRLEITGVSSEEQKKLIDAWLARHRGYLISND